MTCDRVVARAALLALACSWLGPPSAGAASATAAPSARTVAERAFARSVAPLSAHDVTGDLPHNTGKRVSFVCTVTAIVHPDTLIGRCGRDAEPVDMYVLTQTAGLRIGTKLHILGEMQAPAQWVDVTAHSWYTPILKAAYVDRITPRDGESRRP